MYNPTEMNEQGAYGVIKYSSQAAFLGEVFTFQANELWFLKDIL